MSARTWGFAAAGRWNKRCAGMGMRSFLVTLPLIVVVIACTGGDGPIVSDSDGGAPPVNNEGGTAPIGDGDGGAVVTNPPKRDPRCPSTAPTTGGTCTEYVPGGCDYDAPKENCSTNCQCSGFDGGTWECQTMC